MRFVARVVIGFVGLVCTSGFAEAQINPYRDRIAQPLCGLNVYTGIATCWDERWPLLATGQRAVIGETLIGQPGREAGYIVLVNPDPQPQRALVQIILEGDEFLRLPDGSTRHQSHVYPIDLPGYGSYTWDLRGDPLFVLGPHIFRVVVYSERVIAAHSVTWPAAALQANTFTGEVTRVAVSLPRLP